MRSQPPSPSPSPSPAAATAPPAPAALLPAPGWASLGRDILTHVAGRLSAADRRSLYEALPTAACGQAMTDPACEAARAALARALRRHQDRPHTLHKLLSSASARAVLPQLTPPLIAGRPTASVEAQLKVLTDGDGIAGHRLAAAQADLRREAAVQQAIAQTLFALHPHPDCGALFGYLWPTELLAGRMEDVHALALSPELRQCLRGAERLDLRVPVPAEPPPAHGRQRGGDGLFALFDTFGAGACPPAAPPPPRFAFASTAALIDHLCTLPPAASPLRELVLDWGYAVDHPTGDANARASCLAAWLSGLPHLWRLELRHRWRRRGVPGAIAALMDSALARPTPFPALQSLALSWTGDGPSALAALTQAGRERLPALARLDLFRDGGEHRRLHAGELQPLAAWRPGLQEVAHCGWGAPSPGRWIGPSAGERPPAYAVLPLAREDEAGESVHLLLEEDRPARRRLWATQLMERGG